jgi:hypothetical protein
LLPKITDVINMNKIKLFAKTSIILAMVTLLLSLTGCGAGGGFFKGNTQTIQTYDFQKGTEGLKVEFIEGMPPKQLFIGTDFATGIKVKNMGAYDLSGNAELKLTAPEMSAFQFRGNNPQFIQLRGKSLYSKEGEEDIITFPMKALCFPGYEEKIVNNYTRKLKATTCYYYETAANVDICVDTRKFMRQPNEKAECVMNDKTFSGGQGGPVGLTRISPTIIPQSQEEVTVQLSFSVDKLQGQSHEIYNPQAGCTDATKQNEVEIEVQMSNQPLQCNPALVKLKEREAVSTICTTKMKPDLGAFLTPITVKMKYYVQQNALKEITVEPPPGFRINNCASLKSEGPAVTGPTVETKH